MLASGGMWRLKNSRLTRLDVDDGGWVRMISDWLTLIHLRIGVSRAGR